MLVIVLQVAALLAIIILPLIPTKSAPKSKFKPDTNTQNALYAVNQNGSLEKIQKPQSKQLH
jgi:hypothetical protein